MSRRLVRRPRAVRDLEDGAVHLGRDDPRVAQRFLRAVERTLSALARHPGLGRVRAYDDARLRGLRSIRVRGFRNHLLFYRADDDVLELVRVLHGARDVPELFRDEDEA